MNKLFAYGMLVVFVFELVGLTNGQGAVPESSSSVPREGPSPEPEPYEMVITKVAKTSRGIFTLHKVKDKYYYEIPKIELGKEFLWVSRFSRTAPGAELGFRTLSTRVVRWTLQDNRILLRNVNYALAADEVDPIAQTVNAASNDTILMAFSVAAWGPNNVTAVIEVGQLFTADIPEFSARQQLNANSLDASRSFIERISPYPENIEVDVTHTYTRNPPAAGVAAQNSGMPLGSATVVLHHSMVKLSEKPMMPRLFDDRLGYYSVNRFDFSRLDHRAVRRSFITRWRLEKKDPAAEVSVPVKPIVYWIDSATPTKWVPFIKRGVEEWQKAFESAGFKNAIIAKLAPSPKEDPDFSAEDARYSVIRWLPSTSESAQGPHVSDPRTGEILEADIRIHHNIMNRIRAMYFLQVGPLDPRAQKLPLPDELMGRLIEYVVAHEVGHTLGFDHNMKASSTYPQEKVRDKEWVKKMGHTPTLMDYSRFNYVAQPEDGIDPADLIPKIGPYDIWAVAWGYKPIPGAETPDAERHTLDKWAREQDKTPWLRFSTADSQGSDFGELTEAVGDADAVKSTTLGIENLKRVSKLLIPATTTIKGDSYDDLNELYRRMLGQWTLELNHVAAIVGGFETWQKHIGQAGVRFVPVSKVRQQEAVRFLNGNAFVTPSWALDKEILRRIEPMGALDRIRNAQGNVLGNLLSSSRFNRLVEQQAIDGDFGYQPSELLGDVREGIWRELKDEHPKIDPYRRNLQRDYLSLASSKASITDSGGDERSLYRAELRTLDSIVKVAIGKTIDPATKAHLELMRDQIAEILDPRFFRSSAGGKQQFRIEDYNDALIGDNCWFK